MLYRSDNGYCQRAVSYTHLDVYKRQLLKYPNQSTVTIVELLNSEEPLIKQYAQMLFDNDYSLYTCLLYTSIRQGKEQKQLASELARRGVTKEQATRVKPVSYTHLSCLSKEKIRFLLCSTE